MWFHCYFTVFVDMTVDGDGVGVGCDGLSVVKWAVYPHVDLFGEELAVPDELKFAVGLVSPRRRGVGEGAAYLEVVSHGCVCSYGTRLKGSCVATM